MKRFAWAIAGFMLAALGPASAMAIPNGHHTIRGTAELQWALDNAGAHLDVNGIWGPATEAALQHYQQAVGLQPTGKLDKATRSWLDMAG